MSENRPSYIAYLQKPEPFDGSLIGEACLSIAAGLGLFAVTVGTIVLLGWTFDFSILESLHSNWIAMKANTAIGFVLSGAALYLSARRRPSGFEIRTRQVCAALTGLIGVLILIEFLVGQNLRIDELIFADAKAIANAKPFPGRMSPATAANFALIGLTLLLPRAWQDRWPQLTNIPVILVLVSSYLAILGYLYNIPLLYAAFSYTAVALNTAVAFVALAAGIILVRPDRGFVKLVTSALAGGFLARRLLPITIITPVVLGWLRIEGQRLGLFDFELGTALLVGAYTIVFVAAILWILESLNDADRERRHVGLIRRLNAELDDRVAELATVNKDLEAFAHSVAHDLRSPLHAIDGFSQILIEDHAQDLSGDAERYLQAVNRNVRKMNRLIEDLLAFSKLGRKPIKKERINFGQLVRETVAELSPAYDGREIQFAVGDLGFTDGDAALLKQVFVNLIGNAIKFTKNRDPAKIEIGRKPGAATVYFVKDNGAGFDPQYADKLFKMFQRLHGADQFEGTGIGLVTVQRIIERHGGRIWAEGKVDDGATFFFTLGRAGTDGFSA